MLLWAKTGIYRNLVNIQLSHKVKNPVERVLIPREGVDLHLVELGLCGNT